MNYLNWWSGWGPSMPPNWTAVLVKPLLVVKLGSLNCAAMIIPH